MLLVSFEHSKSAVRFTAFNTAHVDSHELDGLMEVLTSLRLAFILESEYNVMLLTPIAILQLFKIQNSKFSFSKGCKHVHGHLLVVDGPCPGTGGWIQLPSLESTHFIITLMQIWVGCTWSLTWLYQSSGHKCVSSPSVNNFFRLKVCYLPYGRREHCILWSCLGHITLFFLPTICPHLCSICRIFQQLPAIFQLKQCLIVKAF